MKKQILTIASIFTVLFATAQTKLPDTAIIKLTPNQVMALSAKIDSMQTIINQTSTLPSNYINAFNRRVNADFSIIWMQINKQLVVDKPAVVKKGQPK